MNIIEKIQKSFLDHISKKYDVSSEILSQVTMALNVDPDKESFGDLTTNVALVLSKILKKSPRDIAQEIVKDFKNEFIEKIEIAGPGFINFTLSLNCFEKILNELLELEDQFFKLDENCSKTHYSVEFVSANPTGPLHLGHGRGGIIGDVLGNILKFLGYKVTKEFYINDAGVQIKKLGLSFKIRCQQLLEPEKNIELPEDGYHGEYLIDLAKKFIAEAGQRPAPIPSNKNITVNQEILKNLSEEIDEFLAEYAKNALLQRVRNTLEKYGINFDVWFSEKSLYQDNAVDKAIQILKDKGFTYESEGALWFSSTKFGDDKDRVLKKNNGEYTYVASDAAYMQNKISRGAEHLIIVLGQDHHSYVVRLKALMSAFGYNPDQIDIILYQLVTLKESGELVRMSKRAGKIVSLEDVIDTVGTDVARFFYLHRKADAHLDFDIDLALKHTDENPVYYAQYAYVRTGSILEKAKEHPELENLTNADLQGLTLSEKFLIKKIISLKELLKNISVNYQTHLLTYYLLELCQLFHKYYGENRVIDLENISQSRARLILISILRKTFVTCFNLLEINKPERM